MKLHLILFTDIYKGVFAILSFSYGKREKPNQFRLSI